MPLFKSFHPNSPLRRWLDRLDSRIARAMDRHGHRLHRWSLAAIFLWFGALKLWRHETATSLLAHTIWLGKPEVMVPLLGAWEVLIAICLFIRPLVRVAVPLLLLRLPGILLAFALHPERCWQSFPLVPTPEGQYLMKDFAIFVATLAIAAHIREPSTVARRH
jgi:uncharacterized membrane protein YkgB